MDDYLINYNEVSSISIEKLLKKIKSRKGKPLKELKEKPTKRGSLQFQLLSC